MTALAPQVIRITEVTGDTTITYFVEWELPVYQMSSPETVATAILKGRQRRVHEPPAARLELWLGHGRPGLDRRCLRLAGCFKYV